MYTFKLIVEGDAQSLEKLLSAEDKDLGRSSYNIKREGEKLIIEITAKDAVAFKTVTNTLSKAFIVWEKMRGLK